MRVRCLIPESAPAWSYEQGVVYDIPEADARMLISLGKFEISDRKCPHCGGSLEELAETAALGAASQTATLSRAAKR